MINLSIVEINAVTDRVCNKPFMRSLHGLCYELAGDDYEHTHNKPPAFQPIIKRWRKSRKETNITLEIRLANEELLENIKRYVQDNDFIKVGVSEYEITSIKIKRQEAVAMNEDIPMLPDYFKLSFETPTAFRQKIHSSVEEKNFNYRTIAFPDVNAIVRSVAKAAYKAFGLKTDFDTVNGIISNLRIINSSLNPHEVKLTPSYPPINSFTGFILVDVTELNKEEKQLFSKLIKISKYTGIGYKKGFGMGHIKILRAGA